MKMTELRYASHVFDLVHKSNFSVKLILVLRIKIQYHAEQIANIGFSNIPNAALVQATQPLYYGSSITLAALV